MMEDGDISSSLKSLQLTEKSALSLAKLDPDYVLDIAVQNSCSDQMLAATSSNFSIRLFSRNHLANIGSIKGHTDVVTGVTFGKTESNLLYSSSQDKTVRCWDLRAGFDKEAQIFTGANEPSPTLTCMDIDSTDKLVCAGTEEEEDNAYILFWDRRKGTLMGGYSDSHQGDITQVCFHPTNKDSLASGSVDGLVCTFDISQTSESDAILYTFNAECSVNRIGWYGSGLNSIYCLTSIDTFHVWDNVDGDEQQKMEDLKDKVQESDAVDYIVDVLSCENTDTDLLVAGTYGGDVRVLEVIDDEVQVVTSLVGGHRDRVRCSHWDRKTSSLVTGAEDSLLCLWSARSPHTSSKHSTKSKVKLKRKGRKADPYQR